MVLRRLRGIGSAGRYMQYGLSDVAPHSVAVAKYGRSAY